MTTAILIERVVAGMVGILFWASAIHSVIVGFRHGFSLPRFIHRTALFLLVLEVTVLVVFPVEVASVSFHLGVLLLCIPVSPYFGWAISGGPVRCRDERMKQASAEHDVARYRSQVHRP